MWLMFQAHSTTIWWPFAHDYPGDGMFRGGGALSDAIPPPPPLSFCLNAKEFWTKMAHFEPKIKKNSRRGTAPCPDPSLVGGDSPMAPRTSHLQRFPLPSQNTPPPFTKSLILHCQVSQYQKKHSPTDTYPNHQPSFISFLHLLQSIASSLFNVHAWQSFCTTSFQVLGLEPSTSYFHTFLHQVIFSLHLPIPSQPVLL